jgi:beta-glucosidase
VTRFAAAADRVAAGADAAAVAAELVAEMTLPEKLGCLDADMPFWPGLLALLGGAYSTQTWPAAVVDRLGVPGLHFADGPRGCVIGPATSFPVSMARGASFDPDLERRVGQAIGAELRASGATFTGAVCLNLLHHPAWGRAQETYGEDPHHVGEMAAALTSGLQQHVMACMKHFALNSMENSRFEVDVSVGERALHEVYLPHFKRVAQSGVASVMSAYNSVNGAWCGENRELLTAILRDEWGWDGFVITDFILGFRDPVASVAAGCNIEMPFAQQRAVALPAALDDGTLLIADVERRVTEVVATFLRFAHVFERRPDRSAIAGAAHRALAREAAVASMVLVSNERGLLPVDVATVGKVAVVGRLAAVANLGDRGSSNVRDTPDPVTPLAGIVDRFPDAEIVAVDALTSASDIARCADADLVVVVVGLTARDEGEYLGPGMGAALLPLIPPIDHPAVGMEDRALGEAVLAGLARPSDGDGPPSGGDRASLRLSTDHEALVAAACAVSECVVVAVIAGSAVVMPWLDLPAATLMLWYAGSEAGTALADVLTGTEPGGRLPFAVPFDEADLPPFDRDASVATYGLLHGQWWLDAHGVVPQLPFGFGLGYTTFALGAARRHGDRVAVDVTNTGTRRGSTVVQVYGSVPGSVHERPPRRLVGFRKVALDAGASTNVEIALDLAQLDVRHDGAWLTEDRPVQLMVGFDAATTVGVT